MRGKKNENKRPPVKGELIAERADPRNRPGGTTPDRFLKK
jgi:hypothetical protein